MVCFYDFNWFLYYKHTNMLFKPVTNSLNKRRCLISTVKYCTSICSNRPNDTGQYQVDLPETETKLVKVGIIGVPNAGKSTFINNLMDRKVSK